MSEYKRLNGENDDALVYRICSDKDSIGRWQDVADILNTLLGTHYGESAYRKKYAAFKQMFESNRDKFSDSSAMLEEIREEQRKLEREKIKFRDERNAWAAQNRIEARVEEKLDGLEERLGGIGLVEFPAHSVPRNANSKKSVLVMLNDLHVGATFNTRFGSYNTDIAKERIGQLLDEVKEIALRHNADECFVSVGGDCISNSIHKSLQVTNRENVMEQIKIAVELISSFCYELSKVFPMVTMINVAGNHSRIDRKDEALHDERLDYLIAYCVDLALKHVVNFYYCSEANIDMGIAMFTINDKKYVSVHGDYDSFTKQGVQNLITMIGEIPYAVLFGHKHFNAVSDCNGIKMVQGGSICGAGDQFTLESRIAGNACSMVCVCGDKGIEAYYPIDFE